MPRLPWCQSNQDEKIVSALGTNLRRPKLSLYRGRVRQQPRCPRAPRAGYETTWRRLMRAWLGPKPGSLSICCQFGPAVSESRAQITRSSAQIARSSALSGAEWQRCSWGSGAVRARVMPGHRAAPARRGGGCGGTRSRRRAGPLRRTSHWPTHQSRPSTTNKAAPWRLPPFACRSTASAAGTLPRLDPFVPDNPTGKIDRELNNDRG